MLDGERGHTDEHRKYRSTGANTRELTICEHEEFRLLEVLGRFEALRGALLPGTILRLEGAVEALDHRLG